MAKQEEKYDAWDILLLVALKAPPHTEEESLLFKQAECTEATSLTDIKLTHKHKTDINRIFREVFFDENIPFPKVDTVFQRTRSRMIIFFDKIKAQHKGRDNSDKYL